MQLGAVADDFTGATDLATTLTTRGFSAAVVIEDRPIDPDRLEGLDAVVIALKTRTAPVAQAVAESEVATDRLLAWGAERIFVKYCSTFDSTDKGNIGPVLDAVAAKLDVDRTVVVPAFPANGRTVQDGLLFVNGQLLEDSPMRHHPLTPMTRSRLVELLTPQTRAALSEIPLATVRAGVDELRAAIAAAPAGYVVIDAVEDHDLRAIAAASDDLRLLSGGAGLATGLTPASNGRADAFPRFAGRRLVVCGSASAATREQIADAREQGHPLRKVDVASALGDPAAEVAALAAWVRGLDANAVPVVYSVGELTDVTADGGASASAVEHVLSSLVAALAGEVDRVIVAGGETSGAVVKALGVDLLRIGPQLAPGVCWSAAVTEDGRELAIVLKSGNFGAIDLFSSAWEQLP